MREYTKAAWEMTKTPEFQATLAANSAEANKGISHPEFVTGIKARAVGFRCVAGEPQQFIRGTPRKLFAILVVLYSVAPAVLVPLWAWHEHSWWLLFGILVSAMATGTGVSLVYNRQKRYSVAGFLIVASVGSWLTFGIHSYYTFFALCASWGLVLFMIANNAEREYALQSLIDNPEVFDHAVSSGRIMIVPKEGSTYGP